MSRTIVILAIGSLGDMRPCVALGRQLRLHGHRVRVLASHRHARFVTDAELEYFPLSLDAEEALQSVDWPSWQSGEGVATMGRILRKFVPSRIDKVLAETAVACTGAQAILTPSWASLGYAVSESYGIPCAFLQLQPWEPTRAFPHFQVAPDRSFGGFGNRISYPLFYQIAWWLIRARTNRWRTQACGLSPLPWFVPSASLSRRDRPVLCGFSSHVVPRPPDWGSHIHVTGYWFDAPFVSWTPPEGLAAFLEAGPPPVYVGFGSWLPGDESEVHRLACAALRYAGVRGVLQGSAAPGGDPGRYGEDMLVVDYVPYEWLFPRTAAVVHHGGSGTTALGLRAGVPTVVVPFVADQQFWAARVAALGVGPKPLQPKHLRAEALGEAVRTATTDPRMRAVASELEHRLRAENGVERACDLIEDWLLEAGGKVLPGRGACKLAQRLRLRLGAGR